MIVVTVLCAFLGFLFLGIAFAPTQMMTAAIGNALYLDTNPIIFAQKLFDGLNKFVLLAVPFFIIAGNFGISII